MASSSTPMEDIPLPLIKYSASKKPSKCLSSIYAEIKQITPQESEDYNLVLHRMVCEKVLRVNKEVPNASVGDVDFKISAAYQPSARYAMVHFRPRENVQSTQKDTYDLKVGYGTETFETVFSDIKSIKSSEKGEVHVSIEASHSKSSQNFLLTQVPMVWIVVSYKREEDTIRPTKLLVYMDAMPHLPHQVPFIPGVGFEGMEGHGVDPKATLPKSPKSELKQWIKDTREVGFIGSDEDNMVLWGDITDMVIAGSILDYLTEARIEEKLHDSEYFRSVLQRDEVGSEAYEAVKKMIDEYVSDKAEEQIELKHLYPSLFTLLCKISGLPSVPSSAQPSVTDLYASLQSDIQNKTVTNPQIYRPIDYEQSEKILVDMLSKHSPMTQIPLSSFGESRNYTELCLLAMFIQRLPERKRPREFVNDYLRKVSGQSDIGTQLIWNSLPTTDNPTEPPSTVFDFVVGLAATEKFTQKVFKSKKMRSTLSHLTNYEYTYTPSLRRHLCLYSVPAEKLTIAFTHGRLNVANCLILVFIPEANLSTVFLVKKVEDVSVHQRLLQDLTRYLNSTLESSPVVKRREADKLPLECYVRKVSHVKAVEPIPIPKTSSYSSAFVTDDLGKLTASVTPESTERPNRGFLVIRDKNGNQTRIPIVWDGVSNYYIVYSNDVLGDIVIIGDDSISVLDVLFVAEDKNPTGPYRQFIADFAEKEKFSDDPAAEEIIRSIVYKPMRITSKPISIKHRFGRGGFRGGLFGGLLLGLTGAGLLYRPYAYPPYYSPPLMGGYYYGSPFYNPWRF